MEISDIYWLTMSDIFKKSVKRVCDNYETNPKYTVKKIFEGLELKGFCVYHDEEDFRVLDECHYIGKDKYAALRMWKFMTTGKEKLRIYCQKANIKMADCYIKIGFKIVAETLVNYIFEKERVILCQAL